MRGRTKPRRATCLGQSGSRTRPPFSKKLLISVRFTVLQHPHPKRSQDAIEWIPIPRREDGRPPSSPLRYPIAGDEAVGVHVGENTSIVFFVDLYRRRSDATRTPSSVSRYVGWMPVP